MAVEDFVQSLLTGRWVIDPVYVFVWVGVMIMVLEDEVSARYPGDVEE